MPLPWNWESEADEEIDLPAVTADSQRLRAAIQGRIPGEITADGAQFTPNWELGLRWMTETPNKAVVLIWDWASTTPTR